MKKNIVFIIPSLDAGGAEKSLINLLSVFDYSKYNVDLILFSKTGLFLNLLPEAVNIIEIKGDYPVFILPMHKSIVQFVKQHNLKGAYNRLLFGLKNKFIKNKSYSEQLSWSNQQVAIPVFNKKYDVAFAFLEKSSIYLVVDKIKAKNKIGWIHTIYTNSGMSAKFDEQYFSRLDKIVAVSKECKANLLQNFSSFKNKVEVINNIVSSNLVLKLSKYAINTDLNLVNTTLILSIGRLSSEKGFDLAIDACEVLIKKGIHVKWYVIGEGSERELLKAKIVEKGLTQNFFLIGLKANPYPYIKVATIFVQPSRYEGKSIAIDEAKILCKPIVTTNYTTVKDQIKNGYNGLVVEMNGESIAFGVERLIADEVLKQTFINNLEKEKFDTEIEIEKVYQLIES